MKRHEEWIDRAKSSLEVSKIAKDCLEWIEKTIKECEENKSKK